MNKKYISANEYLRDVWQLAALIRRSNWRPDLILALWRGGAPVGVAVHEFLKSTGWPCRHLCIKCFSYTGIGTSNDEVKFECANEVLATIKPDEKVLVIDDVFDSGRTAAACLQRLTALNAKARTACVYWKPNKNTTTIKPDFYVAQVDDWLVFPHELDGLTDEELNQKDPELAKLVFACRTQH